jgi:hypothetical protein
MTKKKCLLLVCFSPCKRFYAETIPYGDMINSKMYVNFVKSAFSNWRKNKKFYIGKKAIIYQHDNARPHTAEYTK